MKGIVVSSANKLVMVTDNTIPRATWVWPRGIGREDAHEGQEAYLQARYISIGV